MTSMHPLSEKKRLAITIRPKEIVALFLLLNYIPIYAVSQHIAAEVVAAISVIELVFLVLYALLKKDGINLAVLIWGVYCVWLCLCVLMNNSRNILYAIHYPGYVLGFILLNFIYLERRDMTLLQATRHFLSIIMFITILQQFIDQDMFGYTTAHNFQSFFVSDNYLGYYYTPYICLCLILDFIEKGSIRSATLVEIILCFLSIIRAWSVKSIIGFAIISLYVFFVYRKKIARVFSTRILLAVYLIVYVGILFFGIQNYVSTTVYEYFGKNATLSSRTFIWLSAFKNIRQSLIYGHGINRNGLLSVNRVRSSEFASHNIFLEVIMQTGVPGLTLYILFIAFCLYRASKTVRKAPEYQYEYLLLVFIIFMTYTMGIFSHPIYVPMLYLPFVFCASFDKLIEMHERNMERNKGRKKNACALEKTVIS